MFFPIALLACFSIALSAPALSAADRMVRVGVYQNPPKIFIDDTGRPAGVFIDVIENIATLEGWDLRYVYGTWGEGLDRLQRGEIDLMPDVAHTTERETIFDFHAVPVLSSWFQVYARKGSGIQSILDLAEKRIVVLERSVQQAAFCKKLVDMMGGRIEVQSLWQQGSTFSVWVPKR
jgi:ABC-type amino acid transport substrate-binding protein